MHYGKLINGNINIHSSNNPILTEDGRRIITNDLSVLSDYGYKQIIRSSPSPEEGYTVSGYDWIETEDSIIQSWNYEIAPEEPPSEEERISALEDALLELITLLLPAEEVNE